MKLSIITINYNNAEGLRKTLASVASQTFRDFEHIIVDGGSTDGSVEIIEAYASDVARKASSSVPTGGDGCYAAVYSQDSTSAEDAQPLAQQDTTSPKATQPYKVRWLSEPDNGIYNAMNKGARCAIGEYLLFLNSGDWFSGDDVLKGVVPFLQGYDLIYGNLYHYENGTITNGVYIDPQYISFDSMRKTSLPHPCTFIKNKAFVLVGGYDELYQIISDWAFMMKGIFKFNLSINRIPNYVTVYDTTGISSKMINTIEYERNHFLHKEFPLIIVDYERIDKFMSKRYIKYLNAIRKIINR